jgi:hypothetical protein
MVLRAAAAYDRAVPPPHHEDHFSHALKKLGAACVVVLALAGIAGILGYAAAVSYAAWLNRPNVDPIRVATHASFIGGALGLVGALLLLAT